MPYHLHMGLQPPHLHQALRIQRLVLGRHAAIIDGDGWETWGEAVGTDVNDNQTLHVITEVTNRAESDGVVAALRQAGVLTPMRRNVPAPVDAVLTDIEDWSCLDERTGEHLYLTARHDLRPPTVAPWWRHRWPR